LTTPSLDVAVVAYRSADLLRDCLVSLRAHPPAGRMTIHVVDNASGDGTAEMVAAEFAEMRLTRATRNLGFAAANNLAIRASSAPYFLALNPDARVTAGALDRLVEVMERRPETGISGPRLERPDGRFDHAARRGFPTPLSALGHFTGVGRRLDHGALAAYRAPEVESGPVDAVNGACMLIRRSALDTVGLFDEGYWMYMEDLDLCYRFAEAGWTTWYEPAATVIHVKAGTSGAIRGPRLDYAFHYGMFRFYRKHYAARRGALLNAAVYAGIAIKLGLSVARGALRGTAASANVQLASPTGGPP
jgi:N-acetylglucosaminyl-diphospho-decaprenol L-rhamnosyltransferase